MRSKADVGCSLWCCGRCGDYNRAKTCRNFLSLPRPFLVNLLVMIAFRQRGEIGGAATSPASDVQVGRVAVAEVRAPHYPDPVIQLIPLRDHFIWESSR